MITPQVFTIGIPVYDQVDLMDIAAPCEMFFWMNQTWLSRTAKQKSAQVLLVAATNATVMTAAGVALTPAATFDSCPQLDMLWVPGGYPTALKDRMNDPVFLNFLRTQSEGAKFITSVCEGALLLASAGLLDGYKATTHWAFMSCLRRFKKIKVVRGYPRFVVNKNKSGNRRGQRGAINYSIFAEAAFQGKDTWLKEVSAGQCYLRSEVVSARPKRPLHLSGECS